MCVVVGVHTIIRLWFSYSTWHGLVSFINFSAVKCVGNCRPQYSFCNTLNNRIRKFVCCANVLVFGMLTYCLRRWWWRDVYLHTWTSLYHHLVRLYSNIPNATILAAHTTYKFSYFVICYGNYIVAINFQQNSKKKNL